MSAAEPPQGANSAPLGQRSGDSRKRGDHTSATTGSGATDMEGYFLELAAAADRALASGERYTMGYSAERTDFVRMNRGKVRQPGHVEQRYVDLQLIQGDRHASHLLSVAGDATADCKAVAAALT